MKIGILHLSDIHISSTGGNSILARRTAIAKAVSEHTDQIDVLIIAVSGDIANRGLESEYKIAGEFLEELRGDLSKLAPSNSDIFIITTPGNHDCDFTNHKGTRKALVTQAASQYQNLSTADDDILTTCTEPQTAYRAFALKLRTNKEITEESVTAVRWDTRIQVGDESIIITSLNSAWLSLTHEEQGALLLPNRAIESTPQATICIGMMHHPYGWLMPQHGADVRDAVLRDMDIFLTGHEHKAKDIEYSIDGYGTAHIEAAALQERESGESGFSLVISNTETLACRTIKYIWKGSVSHYSVTEEKERTFRALRSGRSGHRLPLPEYLRRLDDPEVGFTHPNSRSVGLSDVFVYPDLDVRSLERMLDNDTFETLQANEAEAYIRDNRFLVINGEERSGKTALAKILCKESLRRGGLTLLIKGQSIKKPEREHLINLCRRAYSEQFTGSSLDQEIAEGTEIEVIIDDFHKSQLGGKGRAALLVNAQPYFSRIVAFVDEFFAIEDFLAQERVPELLSFKHCILREFGYASRGRLIEKWHQIGATPYTEDQELHAQIARSESVVDTLIGKNIMPSYPIFVLMILQTQEAQKNLSTASGAYGYVYEVLIFEDLSALKDLNITLTPDHIISFASSMAHSMLTSTTTSSSVSTSEFDNLVASYRTRQLAKVSSEQMLRALHACRITSMRDNQVFFRFSHTFYYFAARSLRDELTNNPALARAQVSDLIASIHTERSANILIFLAYLSKDVMLIRSLLEHAKEVFGDTSICSPRDIQLGHIEAWPLELAESTKENYQKSRALVRADRDEAERARGELAKRPDSESSESIDTVGRFNVALKSIQIIGQIARNFPGSLPGDLLVEVTSTCFDLTLRTMTKMIEVVMEHRSDFREWISSYIIETKSIDNVDELKSRTDAVISNLIIAASYGLIRKAAIACGSVHLEMVFESIRQKDRGSGYNLIDLAIRLDHERPVPVNAIISTNHSFQNEHFPSMLLRQLVYEHLTLFPAQHNVRSKLCQEFNISQKERRLVASTNKKLPPPT